MYRYNVVNIVLYAPVALWFAKQSHIFSQLVTLRSEVTYAPVAQLVEQRTENPRVVGSIPIGSTSKNNGSAVYICGFSSSGRAPPCQGGGSEFEPRNPLQVLLPLPQAARGEVRPTFLGFPLRESVLLRKTGTLGTFLQDGVKCQAFTAALMPPLKIRSNTARIPLKGIRFCFAKTAVLDTQLQDGAEYRQGEKYAQHCKFSLLRIDFIRIICYTYYCKAVRKLRSRNWKK